MKKYLAGLLLATFVFSGLISVPLVNTAEAKTQLTKSQSSHKIAVSKVKVRGYTKKNGTYVKPHYRTAPDKKKSNNWSSKGNVNPYTGKKGYK